MDAVLRLTLPTPYPVGPVHAWWLDGPEPVLVDTGMPGRENVDLLVSLLAAHGRRLGDVRRVLLTHDHVDHAGSAGDVARLGGATVHLHVLGRLGQQWTPQETLAMATFLLRCGMPGEVLSRVGSALGRATRLSSAEPEHLVRLRGGEAIDSPLGPLEVIATPGHGPDHVCYLAREAGLLFCGDTLLEGITPNPILHLDAAAGFRRIPSLLQYLDSLDALAALPVRRAHPGHGPDIEDVPALIAHDLAFVRGRQAVFLDAVRRGARTPWALATAVFGDQDPMGLFLALSESVACLDLLERDGDVEVLWDDDPVRVVPRGPTSA